MFWLFKNDMVILSIPRLNLSLLQKKLLIRKLPKILVCLEQLYDFLKSYLSLFNHHIKLSILIKAIVNNRVSKYLHVEIVQVQLFLIFT